MGKSRRRLATGKFNLNGVLAISEWWERSELAVQLARVQQQLRNEAFVAVTDDGGDAHKGR